METRSKSLFEPRHDFTVTARRVVEQTIGHKLIGHKPTVPPPDAPVEYLSTAKRADGRISDPEEHLGFSRSSRRTTVQSVIGAIVRRMNIRSTVHLTGVPQNRVKAIIVRVGEACAQYHQKSVSNMRCGDLQCSLNMVLQEKTRGPMLNRRHLLAVGSAWTWTSIDPESRFVPSWLVAPRNVETARAFLKELTSLSCGRIQVAGRGVETRSSNHDGRNELRLDYEELARAFGSAEDYLHAVRAHVGDPPLSMGTGRIPLAWLNLLSPGFSRQVQRHAALLALLFTFHNFATADPVRQESPAMATGIADHVWDVSEFVGLVEQRIGP